MCTHFAYSGVSQHGRGTLVKEFMKSSEPQRSILRAASIGIVNDTHGQYVYTVVAKQSPLRDVVVMDATQISAMSHSERHDVPSALSKVDICVKERRRNTSTCSYSRGDRFLYGFSPLRLAQSKRDNPNLFLFPGAPNTSRVANDNCNEV